MNMFGAPEGKETLFKYLMKYKRQFIISSIGGFVYNTTIVLGPILMGRLIDAAAESPGQTVILSALSFIGITTFFQLARYVKRWYMRDQFNRVACDLRQTFIERTLGRPLSELENETVGDLMSRTVGDITEVVDTVMVTLNEGWDTWLLMLSYFVILLIQDWKITLIASIMIPVTVFLAQTMRHNLYRYSMSVRTAASKSNSGLQLYLEGIPILRLFGREKSEASGIQDAFEEQSKYRIKEILLQQVLLPIYSLVAGLGVVIVIALGGQKVVTGEWSVGTFNAFLIMFIALSTRTRVAARVFNRWHGARAAWTRVKEKIQIQTQGLSPAPLIQTSRIHKITIKNLGFRYDETPVLSNISFEAKKGQVIGITGSVGSGKTALAKALTGIYSYIGSISIDGEELSKLESIKRCQLVGYTGHEQFLFSMSIRENITLSSENIDHKRLEKALIASALQDDLKLFKDGLDSKVGERGVRVSGGQRQRIALARAIYSQTPILILDEPFSAVDIATEQKIINQLKTAYNDRIVFLFTHRITSFTNTDDILVLEKGRVIEKGTHQELMTKTQGVYRDIYAAQKFMESSE